MTGKIQLYQLPLNINLRDDATFENFYTGKNTVLIAALKTYPNVYIWGESGQGKTHLLEAACHQIHQENGSAAYLPFKKHSSFQPEILEGLEFQTLVCLDDLDQIASIKPWEEALFHFYNRAFAQKNRLIISAQVPPQQMPILLPDLKSRLGSGLVFQVKPLSDEDKSKAILRRAQQRGLHLTSEIADYLLTRYSRSMPELITALNIVDKAALAAQRKLTIPFIKWALNQYESYES